MNLDLLNDLVTISSPSGFEDDVLDYCESYVNDKIKSDTNVLVRTNRDTFGNLIVSIRTRSPNAFDTPRKILISSHADQIGFMVSYINDDGFVFFKLIGGWDVAVLLGQRVKIKSSVSNAFIHGVISRRATHLMTWEEQKQEIQTQDMWIDFGFTSKEDAEKYISIGDYGIIDPKPIQQMCNDIISGQALDNRISIYTVLSIVNELNQIPNLVNEFYIVINKTEEIGDFTGATNASNYIKPDCAIVIDTTPATDQPGIESEKHGHILLRAGPSIGIGANSNFKMSREIITHAKALNIPFQIEPIPNTSGTDMDGVAASHVGVPSIIVSIPCRYLHTPVETVSMIDVDNTIKLIHSYATSIKPILYL